MTILNPIRLPYMLLLVVLVLSRYPENFIDDFSVLNTYFF